MPHAFPRNRPKPQKRQQSVQDQELQADLEAAEQHFLVFVYKKADQGGKDGYQGYPFVIYGPLGEYTKGKQAEQGTIGITGHLEDHGDHTGIVHLIEYHHKKQEYGREGKVHPLAYLLAALVTHVRAALYAQDVYTERGGKCSDGAIGTGEKGRDQGYDEDH